MIDGLKNRLYRLLRWSERYTKTDMVYLATSGWWINLNFIFVSIFSFLLSIAFANLVPKEVFGTYQYILSIATVAAAFTLSGYNTAITQAVARGFEGALSASIRPQLLWNILPALAALLWASHYFVAGQTTLGMGLVIVGLTLPILNTYNSYSAYLVGKKDFKHSALYAMGGNAAYYACIFLAVVFFPHTLVLVFVNLIITTGASVFFYMRTMRLYAPHGANDPGALPYARHLSIMNALNTIAAQIDNVLVFHFLGAAELALYSIATLLPERLGGVFKSITSSALPRFAERNMQDIRKTLLLRLGFFLIGIVAMVGTYALVAPLFFHLIYPKYEGAIIFSQIYALVLVSYIGALINSALSAHRNVRALYVLNTVLPIVQIGLQIAGIVLGGLWGLIIAKIIAAAVGSVAALFLLYSQRPAQ